MHYKAVTFSPTRELLAACFESFEAFLAAMIFRFPFYFLKRSFGFAIFIYALYLDQLFKTVFNFFVSSRLDIWALAASRLVHVMNQVLSSSDGLFTVIWFDDELRYKAWSCTMVKKLSQAAAHIVLERSSVVCWNEWLRSTRQTVKICVAETRLRWRLRLLVDYADILDGRIVDVCLFCLCQGQLLAHIVPYTLFTDLLSLPANVLAHILFY